MKVPNYRYMIGNVLIFRRVYIKHVGIHIVCELIFIPFLFSRAITLPGLIRNITFSFSTMNGIIMLYFASVRSKLQCSSVT
jgi:hypothetical protein